MTVDFADWIDIDAVREGAEVDPVEGIAWYYLGTVFSLTPSGKYYTVWACSHLTEEEIDADTEWWEALDSYLEPHGMWAASGDDDPCDVFVCFDASVQQNGGSQADVL